jgi:hypothetical protein
MFIQYHFGMKVAIVRGMHEDSPLSKAELMGPPWHRGQLLVEDLADDNAFERPIRRARRISPTQGTGDIDVVTPLFEPALIKVRDERMTLVGDEIHAENGTTRRVFQV